MKFSYSWLKTHLETTATPQEIADKLTAIGLEVDQFTDSGEKYAPFVIAEIIEAVKHPNADKLKVCTVNNGAENLQIVCGAANARAGIKVVLAPVGAMIPNGNFQIKKSKIRNFESNGMLCSADELELGGDSAGIIEVDAAAKTGGSYAEFAGLNDSVFEINVTPNRADCLSVYGIARDLAASGLGNLKPLENSNIEGIGSCPIKIKSESYYVGRHFSGVKNCESPAWLKQRLTSIGLTPISALVDITNFINFDLGQPLHVFDAGKLRGDISVRHANKGEKINALNNNAYELAGSETVIADESGPLAIAGVIGGLESAVGLDSTNVFLEAAYFDADSVAKTGRMHQIITDSRYRFERGVDPDMVKTAAEIASGLIIEICGGTASEFAIAGVKPVISCDITFNFDAVKNLGGIEINEQQAGEILRTLGFKIAADKITTPSWRGDVKNSADLVEEIARIYGYDKISPVHLPFKAKVDSAVVLKNNSTIRARLNSAGLNEVVTYSFINPKTVATFGFENVSSLQNPISNELSVMRPAIIPALLETVLKNHNRGSKDLGFFEIGPVFAENSEQTMVSGIRTGKNNERNVYNDYRNVDAFDAKADLLSVLNALSAPSGKILRNTPDYYHPGRSGSVSLGKNVLGYFGELHPRILRALDISTPVVGFEVFVGNVPAAKKKHQSLTVSDYQTVSRDFAFVVPKDLNAGDLINSITKADKLINDVYIFDIYQGDKLDSGKKSVGLSIEIQPQDKTLTDVEIEGIVKRVNEAANKEFGAVLRS